MPSVARHIIEGFRAFKHVPAEPESPKPKTVQQRPYHPTSYAIRKRVCESHGVTKEELLGAGQAWKTVAARRDLARQLRAKGWEFAKIGRFMCKHHSTIIHLLATENRVKQPRKSRRKSKEAAASGAEGK